MFFIVNWDQLIEKLLSKCPIGIKQKNEVWWWYIVNFFYKLGTLLKGTDLVNNYYTMWVLNGTLYVPDLQAFKKLKPRVQYKMLRHEIQHYCDYKYVDGWRALEQDNPEETSKWHRFKYIWKYLFNYEYRLYIECRGYFRNLEVDALHYNVSGIPFISCEFVKKQLESTNYNFKKNPMIWDWIQETKTALDIWVSEMKLSYLDRIPKSIDFTRKEIKL